MALFLGLGFLPFLWNPRSLEYEAALLQAVVVFVFLPFYYLLEKPQANLLKLHSKEGIWGRLLFLVKGGGLLYLPALIAFLIGECPCSWPSYSSWFLILVLPAYLFASGVAWLFASLKPKWGTKKLFFGYLLFLSVLVGQLLISFWFFPQKRLVHLAFGFLHGPIYDRLIYLDEGVLYARLGHALLGLALCCLPLRGERRGASGSLLLLALLAFFMSQGSASLGLGHDDLKKRLDLSRSGPGYEVYFSKKLFERKKDRLETLFQEIKFHREDLAQLLKIDPLPLVKIYVYDDARQKKLAFGGGATDVTDVVSPSIHIKLEGPNHPSLRHELVHALVSDIAYHGLGFHPNMAFTEGLAVALAPSKRRLSLHEAALSILDSKRIENLAGLFSPLFWRFSGGRAYAVAGSFIRYAIDEYGIEKVLALYSGASMAKTFAKPEGLILDEYETFLRTHFDLEKIKLEAEVLYRDEGVLKDLCPHTKALLYGAKEPLERLRLPLSYQKGEALDYELALNPSDRSAQVLKMRKDLSTIIRPQVSYDRRLRSFIEEIKAHREWPPTAYEDIEWTLLWSDLERIVGRYETSLQLLKELKTYLAQHEVGDQMTRAIFARLLIEKDLPPAEGLLWRIYLSGLALDHSPPKAGPDSPFIVHYLHLRRREGISAVDLDGLASLPPPPYLAQTFYVEWFYYLGLGYLDQKKYLDAALMVEEAAQRAPEGQKAAYRLEARLFRSFAKKL